jgi:hypothetical protein
MSTQIVATTRPTEATAADAKALIAQSRPVAERTYKAVAEAYLAFRRQYYHELDPSLATIPPAHAEIHRAEVAQLADSTLRLTPQAIRQIPVLGGFLAHLESVANIHSMSERERTALHNMTLTFLHGVKDGVQPWYLEWLLDTAHNLAQVTHPQYYEAFPYEGLLYKDPQALKVFDAAVHTGDLKAIQNEVEDLGQRLVEVSSSE